VVLAAHRRSSSRNSSSLLVVGSCQHPYYIITTSTYLLHNYWMPASLARRSALYQVLGEQVLASSSDTQLLAPYFLEDF
jgi:hypothetical protein